MNAAKPHEATQIAAAKRVAIERPHVEPVPAREGLGLARGAAIVLAVIAIASHLACAVRAIAIGHGARRDGWSWLLAAAAGIGAAAAAVIIAALQLAP